MLQLPAFEAAELLLHAKELGQLGKIPEKVRLLGRPNLQGC